MDNCLFCKIARRQLPVKILFESDSIIAFPDINPSADRHILIVPKEHIGGIQDIKAEHGALLAEVYQVVKNKVKEFNLENDSYRVVVNGGKAQHVPHLHFHLLGGQWKKMV